MGQFTLTYDNAEVTALLEGFRISCRYQDTVDDPENPGQTIPNPETLPQFAKRQLREYLRAVHKVGVISLADVDNAKQVAITDAETRSEGFDVA